MEWIHVGVLILAGSGADVPPSTHTVNSQRFHTIEACESALIQTRLLEIGIATKVKTSGVFVTEDYNQVVVSAPVNLTGYGKGTDHFSCIPISGD